MNWKDEVTEKDLDEYGEVGWELINIISMHAGHKLAVFKRERDYE